LLKPMQSGLSADHQMLDALDALRAGGMPVALVTNSFGRDCNECFDLHALADVVISSDAGRMTVREGIAAPVDPDSFGQLGASPRRSDLRARDRSRAGQGCPARDPLFWTRVRLQLHGRA
jgi:hypothetical protein